MKKTTFSFDAAPRSNGAPSAPVSNCLRFIEFFLCCFIGFISGLNHIPVRPLWIQASFTEVAMTSSGIAFSSGRPSWIGLEMTRRTVFVTAPGEAPDDPGPKFLQWPAQRFLVRLQNELL